MSHYCEYLLFVSVVGIEIGIDEHWNFGGLITPKIYKSRALKNERVLPFGLVRFYKSRKDRQTVVV